MRYIYISAKALLNNQITESSDFTLKNVTSSKDLHRNQTFDQDQMFVKYILTKALKFNQLVF